MFDITAEQLQRIRNLQLLDQLTRVLVLAFPDEPPIDDAQFRAELQKSIRQAARHRLRNDRLIARYVCIAYALGTDFDTRFPAAVAILNDLARPAEERLTLLEFWADKLLQTLEEP